MRPRLGWLTMTAVVCLTTIGQAQGQPTPPRGGAERAPAGPKGCASNDDCPRDQVCTEGRCSAAPAAPSPTATTPPAAPTPSGATRSPAPPTPCGHHDDCRPTEVCQQGRCIAKPSERPSYGPPPFEPLGGTCETATDCGAGYRCDRNVCTSEGTAGTSGDDIVRLGVFTLVGSYLVSAGAGIAALSWGAARGGDDQLACADSAPFAFIPLAGPLVSILRYPNHVKVRRSDGEGIDCTQGLVPATVLMVADGFAQFTGVAVIAAGLAVEHSTETTMGGIHYRVGPQVRPGFAGVGVTVWGY